MKILFLTISSCLFTALHAQQYKTSYEYDNSGNVKSRITISLPTTRVAVDTASISKNVFEDTKTQIKIYPNPTKGLLKIEIDNYASEENTTILLYDLAGRMLINRKASDNQIDLDLGSYQNGTYILRILRDEEKVEYKIIKN